MIIKAAKPALLSSNDAYPFYVFWFLRSNSLIYIIKNKNKNKNKKKKNLQYNLVCGKFVLKACLTVRSKSCMEILF